VQVTFDVAGFSGFFAGSAPAVALPLTLNKFSANIAGNRTLISWTTSNEMEVKQFEVQRGVDGLSFVTINTALLGSGNVYHYYDIPPAAGSYFYRLKMIEQDGTFSLSSIVNLSFDNALRLVAFPNPTKGILTLRFPQSESGSIKILNSGGLQLMLIPVTNTATTANFNLSMFANGRYQVQWSDGKQTLNQVIWLKK
jgi:hypothetical protein